MPSKVMTTAKVGHGFRVSDGVDDTYQGSTYFDYDGDNGKQ